MAIHLINYKYKVAKQDKEGYVLAEISEQDYQEQKSSIKDDSIGLSYTQYIRDKGEDEINTNYTDLIITNIVRI